MEVCEIRVTLGYTVCAFSVYAAPLCMSFKRFGIGAREMASGRSPSMDRISTRLITGTGVGASVGVDVSVEVAGNVGGSVAVAVTVAGGGKVGSGAGVSRSEGLVLWQADRSTRKTSRRILLNCVMDEILPVKPM